MKHNPNILIVGDVGIDCYIEGGVKRTSQEAGVPIVLQDKTYDRLGLAANVAANVQALYGRPILVSVIGCDHFGDCLLSLSNTIDSRIFVREAGRKTTTKIRVVGNGAHLSRIDHEDTHPISKDSEQKILKAIKKWLPKCKVAILQDYAKGVLTPRIIKECVRLSKKHGTKLMVDPNKNTPVENYRGAWLISPNFSECFALAKDATSVHEAAMKIKSNKIENVVVTMGEKGMYLFNEKSELLVKTTAKNAKDVTGAGDTVIATIATATIYGLKLTAALAAANYAAGVVVEKFGTSVCTAEELKEAISEKT